jgi:mannose-P-dolichol utilization defect protein 1
MDTVFNLINGAGGGPVLAALKLTEQCQASLSASLVSEASGACVKTVAASLVGYLFMVAGLFLKAPQILKIVDAKSGAGLSLPACCADVLLYTVSVAYAVRTGLPLTAFGDQALIMVQNCVIVVLLWHYAAQPIGAGTKALSVLGLVGVVAGCAAVPEAYLVGLPGVSMCLTLAARVPQIAANFSNGHTGVMSPVPVTLTLVGASIRILTTLVESGLNVPILAGLGVSISTNLVLVSQLWMYRAATAAVAKAKKKQ